MVQVVIEHFVVRKRHFTIVDNNGFYCAIESKYITDGKLNTKLNGLQMHANKVLSGCLDSVKDACEIDYLMDNGMDFDEAFNTYYAAKIANA